ncbi:MAG: hypothetical protein V1749_03660 [Candidatus Desantisbacteria bacterium]
MQINDGQQMYGNVRITLKDENGRVIEERKVRNAIVNNGRELVAKLLVGETGAGIGAITHMAVGSGVAPTISSMEGLEVAAPPRSIIGKKTVTMVGEEAQIDIEATFKGEDIVPTGTVGLREAGIFTAVTGGIMYNRVTFDEIPLRAGLEITLQWKLCFPASI